MLACMNEPRNRCTYPISSYHIISIKSHRNITKSTHASYHIMSYRIVSISHIITYRSMPYQILSVGCIGDELSSSCGTRSYQIRSDLAQSRRDECIRTFITNHIRIDRLCSMRLLRRTTPTTHLTPCPPTLSLSSTPGKGSRACQVRTAKPPSADAEQLVIMQPRMATVIRSSSSPRTYMKPPYCEATHACGSVKAPPCWGGGASLAPLNHADAMTDSGSNAVV